MSATTLCRRGYNKKFPSVEALREYLTRNNFINCQLIKWEECADFSPEDLIIDQEAIELIEGKQLYVIIKDDCEEEADLGAEFVFFE